MIEMKTALSCSEACWVSKEEDEEDDRKNEGKEKGHGGKSVNVSNNVPPCCLLIFVCISFLNFSVYLLKKKSKQNSENEIMANDPSVRK